MTNERPLILITNDDGVWAKGINELIECLKDRITRRIARRTARRTAKRERIYGT